MLDLQKSIENKQKEIDKLNRDIEELKKDLQTKDLIKIPELNIEVEKNLHEDMNKVSLIQIPKGFIMFVGGILSKLEDGKQYFVKDGKWVCVDL